jgi:hypothetical protein
VECVEINSGLCKIRLSNKPFSYDVTIFGPIAKVTGTCAVAVSILVLWLPWLSVLIVGLLWLSVVVNRIKRS